MGSRSGRRLCCSLVAALLLAAAAEGARADGPAPAGDEDEPGSPVAEPVTDAPAPSQAAPPPAYPVPADVAPSPAEVAPPPSVTAPAPVTNVPPPAAYAPPVSPTATTAPALRGYREDPDELESRGHGHKVTGAMLLALGAALEVAGTGMDIDNLSRMFSQCRLTDPLCLSSHSNAIESLLGAAASVIGYAGIIAGTATLIAGGIQVRRARKIRASIGPSAGPRSGAVMARLSGSF